MVARPPSPVGALIPRFFAGRHVLITGATGFMGKVLVERLLSTCPDIGCLYLLLRPKKEVAPEKRLQQLKQSQVFDVIRQTNPAQLDKLRVIPGDVSEPGLGLPQSALQILNEVSIVYHSAATLRFDEPLPMAVRQNVLSAIRMMELCDQLPNIEAFMHVSTAYSNSENSHVGEKVYEPPAQLHHLLSLLEVMPPRLLATITPQYISPKTNTYTFTKAMAEEAVRLHGTQRYPTAIFRPTIVVSSLQHPFPGWIENLNGPSGIIAAAGKGLLHVFTVKESARADMLPVDIAIDTLIAATWETAIDKSKDIRVYNCSTQENPTTWGHFEKAMRMYIREYPMNSVIWYPSGTGVENRYAQKILEFCLQTLPLHAAEYILRSVGMKPQLNLITASQKMSAMNGVLGFFALNEWDFDTHNVQKLRSRLSLEDRRIYNVDPNSINWQELYRNFVKGTRRYLLKEKDQDIEKAKRHMQKMYYLHKGAIMFTILLVFRLMLQNRYMRDLVYGILRLLMYIVSTTYSRVTAQV
ncbi:PREDICTED: fatty acyl-CoA reductase 1-like [Papilio xuthus]|uniref:Fatty acyl-CoA reductase n=1 Tax=Papilio xuthus TaxID=66420 RepID=A0AAJ6ZMQ0_PAPXU|nr:PREDICTED: fatty acyl-CoA reductase 1-like [Papilio xuthus]XP_013175882.1 PREDICTED: fatty acyl-CoA reductase 1-like [Papilio xuthus]